MIVTRFSLIERSGAAKKGPINHEFVNLAAEFANISRTVIGKSDRVSKSRDRARASREPRSIKYRPLLVLAHSSGLRGWPKEGQVGSRREIQGAIRAMSGLDYTDRQLSVLGDLNVATIEIVSV